MHTKRLLVGLAVLLASMTGTASASASDVSANVAGPHCVANLATGEESCHTSMAAAEEAVSGVVIFKYFEHADFNFNEDGRSFTVKSSTGCTPQYDDERNKKIRALALDNAISSWLTIGNCRVRFWDGANFGPQMSLLSYVGVDCADMRYCFGTDWNDRASSFALT